MMPAAPAFPGRVSLLALAAGMPLGMIVATRSATAMLVFAAVAAVVSFWGTWRVYFSRIGQTASADGLAQAAAAAAAFSAVSLLWTHDRTGGVWQFLEMLLPAAAFAVLWRPGANPPPGWAENLLLLCVLVASVIVVADLRSDLVLRKTIGAREASFAYNRPVVLLVLTLFPLASMLAQKRRFPALLTAFAAVASAAYSSESGAALVALCGGMIAAMAALAAPRLMHWLGLAGLAAGFALAPAAGRLLAMALPESVLTVTASMNSSARIRIWQAYGGAVETAPLKGAGFGSSVSLDKAGLSHGLPPDLSVLLGAGHPHNMFLQVWVELGAIGVLLTALSIALAYLRYVNPQSHGFAWRFGFTAAAAAIAFVSHGAWQGWYWSIIAACGIWFSLTAGPAMEHGGSLKTAGHGPT